MSATAAGTAYLAAACLYAGFQLTIRAVVYPQMALAAASGTQAWRRYEAAHQRRVSLVVGPLFLALIVTTGLLPLSGVPSGSWGAALALLIVLLGVTVAGAVPQHRMLSESFDAAAHRRLLRWDTGRLAVAVAQVAVAGLLVW